MPVSISWLVTILVAAGCASSGKQPAAAGLVALDEPASMDKLRASVKADPAGALSISDEGERRFGGSSFSEERRALAIQALVNLDRIGAARSRAYDFLERYPSGPYSANVAAMTGVHVTPRVPSQDRH
jgi:hypothetical protein